LLGDDLIIPEVMKFFKEIGNSTVFAIRIAPIVLLIFTILLQFIDFQSKHNRDFMWIFFITVVCGIVFKSNKLDDKIYLLYLSVVICLCVFYIAVMGFLLGRYVVNH